MSNPGFETLANSVRGAVHDSMYKELQSLLYENVHENLDIPSTHTTIEAVYMDNLEVKKISGKSIFFSGSGGVDCRLQYGSNSDVKNDTGTVNHSSYTLEFTATSPTHNPHDLSIEPINIDTSSFFE